MGQTLAASESSKLNVECKNSKLGNIPKNDRSKDNKQFRVVPSNSKYTDETEDTGSIEIDAITINPPTENKPFTISDKCLRRHVPINAVTQYQFEARHERNEMRKYKIIILS